MKNVLYAQCKLEKTISATSKAEQTSFIPYKFAIVNNVLKLKDDNGDWDDGWVVTSVGKPVDEAYLPDAHKAVREHRKNTGDALPKRG